MKLCVGLSFICAIIFYINAQECTSERKQSFNHEARLQHDLLCAYNPEYRPVKDHKNMITVKVRFNLQYINFDPQEETFTLHSWVSLKWKDELLSWIPSDYGDINDIMIDSKLIWTPSMVVFKHDASTDMLQADEFRSACYLTSEGYVSCSPLLSKSGICSTKLRHWPYDVRNCSLYYGSMLHKGELINLTFTGKLAIITGSMQDNPGWNLQRVFKNRFSNYYSNNTHPRLVLTFELKRAAAGLAAIVVVPSIVIVLLTLTSFLLDIKDPTRLFLACFSLFGHFIFLTEIGYDIPKHSSDTPVILLFLRDSMVLTLVGIVQTLFLKYIRKRTTPPPNWIVSVTRLISNGPGKYVVFTEFEPRKNGEAGVLSEDVVGKSLKSFDLEWIQFANIFNSILFIVIVFVYLVLICIYIPYEDNDGYIGEVVEE